MNISGNKYVECSYELYTSEGEGQELVEKTSDDSPLSYIHGMGMMLPCFEKNLFDKKVGDKFDFTLSPEEAYGDYKEDLCVDLPKSVFANEKGEFDDNVVFKGNMLPMMDSEGNRLQGLVMDITDDMVKMDFNHPMAGETLHFIGEILSVREATEEDINRFFNSSCGCGCDCSDEDHKGCGSGCGCSDDEDGCGCGCGC